MLFVLNFVTFFYKKDYIFTFNSISKFTIFPMQVATAQEGWAVMALDNLAPLGL
jgi:hypothetical protein